VGTVLVAATADEQGSHKRIACPDRPEEEIDTILTSVFPMTCRGYRKVATRRMKIKNA
jgi:hypothetical protein